MYRSGKLDDIQAFFDKIEKDIPKAVNEAGFNFAKGLYNQYISQLTISFIKMMIIFKFQNNIGYLANLLRLSSITINVEEIRSLVT